MSMNNPISNLPPSGQPMPSAPASTGLSKFKPVDPMRLLRANWLWIALSVILGAALGAGAWFALDEYAPRYTSEAQYSVQVPNIDLGTGRSIGGSRMAEIEPILNQQVQAAKAAPLLREILNTPSVQNTDWFAQFGEDMGAAYEALDEEVIKSRAVPTAPLFLVSAVTPNETDAQVILAAHREEFVRRQQAEAQSDSERDLRAAQRRKEAAEEKITQVRGAIARFLNTTPLEDINGQSDSATLRVRFMTAELSDLRNELGALEASYQQLIERQEAGDYTPTGEERQYIEATPAIQNIDSQLLQLQIAREPLLEKFKEGHRAVRELDSQILKIERERERKYDEKARTLFEAKLESTVNALESARENLNTVNTELAELKVQRQELVRLRQEYDTLVREQQQAEEERAAAEQTIEQLRLADRNESRVVVRVSVPPQQAEQSFPPEPYIMIPGVSLLVTGLVIGLIFLREMTDQRVRSASDVSLVPDASLVGIIPDAQQDPSKTKTIDRVVELHPNGLLAEAFRQARTAILSKIDRRGYKTLMMVSAKADAGVTSSAHNLATSCALSGKRVLLVDANFRRPGLAKLTGIAGQPGLADALQGTHRLDQLDQLIHPSHTTGLSLMPAGDSANAPIELFETPAFRDLLARLESDYDLVIIDAPPALLTSDAQLLSRHIDAMVLVARAQTDTRGILQRLYRELDGQRADILGTLLNGVQAAAGGYMKRNFREFHDYGGSERRRAPRHANSANAGAAANPSSNGTHSPDADVFGDAEAEAKDVPAK